MRVFLKCVNLQHFLYAPYVVLVRMRLYYALQILCGIFSPSSYSPVGFEGDGDKRNEISTRVGPLGSSAEDSVLRRRKSDTESCLRLEFSICICPAVESPHD